MQNAHDFNRGRMLHIDGVGSLAVESPPILGSSTPRGGRSQDPQRAPLQSMSGSGEPHQPTPRYTRSRWQIALCGSWHRQNLSVHSAVLVESSPFLGIPDFIPICEVGKTPKCVLPRTLRYYINHLALLYPCLRPHHTTKTIFYNFFLPKWHIHRDFARPMADGHLRFFPCGP